MAHKGAAALSLPCKIKCQQLILFSVTCMENKGAAACPGLARPTTLLCPQSRAAAPRLPAPLHHANLLLVSCLPAPSAAGCWTGRDPQHTCKGPCSLQTLNPDPWTQPLLDVFSMAHLRAQSPSQRGVAGSSSRLPRAWSLSPAPAQQVQHGSPEGVESLTTGGSRLHCLEVSSGGVGPSGVGRPSTMACARATNSCTHGLSGLFLLVRRSWVLSCARPLLSWRWEPSITDCARMNCCAHGQSEHKLGALQHCQRTHGQLDSGRHRVPPGRQSLTSEIPLKVMLSHSLPLSSSLSLSHTHTHTHTHTPSSSPSLLPQPPCT